jgi:hypothetical protein
MSQAVTWPPLPAHPQGAAANKVISELLALEDQQLLALLQLLQQAQATVAAFQQASQARCAAYAAFATISRQQRVLLAPDDAHLQAQLQLLAPQLAESATDMAALLADASAAIGAALQRQGAAAAAVAAAAAGGATPRTLGAGVATTPRR